MLFQENFYPSRVLLKSPGFSKMLTIHFDKIVTKTQKLFFRHKTVLKLKNWRKQNQPGIKFYITECVEITFGTFLTEISQNLDFPHFQLFQIFAQMLFQHILYCKIWFQAGFVFFNLLVSEHICALKVIFVFCDNFVKINKVFSCVYVPY